MTDNGCFKRDSILSIFHSNVLWSSFHRPFSLMVANKLFFYFYYDNNLTSLVSMCKLSRIFALK